MGVVRRITLLGCAAGMLASLPALRAGEFARGMTVSSHRWGEEWGRPEMAQTMDELRGMGVEWIAIHPYARIQADGRLHWDADPEPDYIVKPLRWARERGMKVFMVPHIAYWGTPFLWRGEITFDSVEGWQRFFNDYERWIVHLAEISGRNGAEAFCVGLEYTHAVKYERRWRSIIAQVRRVFPGPLTYGGNWDTYQDVPFWDALDAIGVLAYFPLSKAEDPTPEQIRAGWEPWMKKLGELSKKTGKPVVFTEIGYNTSTKAAAQPWDFHNRGGPKAAEIQHRLVEVALQLEGQYPFLRGMFFWKWFPRTPRERPETFDLRRPALESLISEYWGGKAQAALKSIPK